MKWFVWCLISCCGLLFTACVDDRVNESQKKEPLPEIAILEEVQQIRWDKQQREALIQSAPFLNSTTAAHNLVSHLEEAESSVERSAVREVLKRMTCDPERIILERLRTGENPEHKGKLIPALMNFQSAQGALLLVNRLDDTRRADFETYPQEQPTHPARVCDIAYNFLI